MVQCLHKDKLKQQVDTPWRRHLNLRAEETPAWRSLYKAPLTKKVADLQRRVLHGILAVNWFLCVIKQAGRDTCPFCPGTEMLFHCFNDCSCLSPLFSLLDSLLLKFGQVFNKQLFILGFKYYKAQEPALKLSHWTGKDGRLCEQEEESRRVG